MSQASQPASEQASQPAQPASQPSARPASKKVAKTNEKSTFGSASFLILPGPPASQPESQPAGAASQPAQPAKKLLKPMENQHFSPRVLGYLHASQPANDQTSQPAEPASQISASPATKKVAKTNEKSTFSCPAIIQFIFLLLKP